MDNSIKKYIQNKIDFITDRILNNGVTPIMVEFQNKLIFKGTCTIIEHNKMFFIVSATHNFINEKGEISLDKAYISIGKNRLLIRGKLITSSLKNDSKNLVDVCVIKCEEILASLLLKANKFHSIDSLEFNHNFTTENNYLLIGFPDNKNYRDKVGENERLALTTLSEIKPFSKREKYYNQDFNFFIHYSRRKFERKGNLRTIAPIPSGLSGSMIWNVSLPENLEDSNFDFKGVGVLIEYSEKKAVIVGTSLKALIEPFKKLTN